MSMITETNRARTIWLLAAITAAYGLVNVLMFYTTDSFGPVWFATSLAVYGALMAASVAMAVIDTGRGIAQPSADQGGEATEPAPQPTPAPGLELIEEEVLYEVASGELIRARFRVEGTERSLIFAVLPDEVLPLDAIEERLDAIDHRVPPLAGTGEVDAALDRRATAQDEDDDGHDDPGESRSSKIEVTP